MLKVQISTFLKRKCPLKKAQMSYQKAQMSFAVAIVGYFDGKFLISLTLSWDQSWN